jgi:ubiquinone/menaquinone biosynthesis C-methylase UbiE
MEQQLEQIRDQQKATWNKFSSGWKKWDDLTLNFLRPFGNEMIRLIAPKDGDVVLDVAAGTGEPGLTIATLAIHGKVVITDLAEDMLAIARERAEERGITNVETCACDATELPFADNTFDAISCRFGLMFFPDMLKGVKEMVRVLKPGGRLALAVWNVPEKNFWVTAIMGTIARNVQLDTPPPDAPGMFRCAGSGFMESLFAQAGLKNISAKEVIGNLDPTSIDLYWDFMTEVAAPVVAGLSKADDATKAKIKREVYEAVNEKFPDGDVRLVASALVLYGVK